MSYFSGITDVQVYHNPNEGRVIVNENFRKMISGVTESVNSISGGTSSSGTSVFTSGSTGSYSIKAINDSGLDTTGDYAYSEGYGTMASGFSSHAEGYNTKANGEAAHSEGGGSIADGNRSHAEGSNTIAFGDYSHSGGLSSIASGETSFIHSVNSLVTGARSVVLGGQNITGSTDDTVYVPRLELIRTDAAPLNLPVLSDSFSSSTHGDVWISTGATETLLNIVIGGFTKSVELT